MQGSGPAKLAVHHALGIASVDILVVNYNGSRWWPGFIESLAKLDYPPDRLRLIVVDNCSTDDSIAKISGLSRLLNFPVTVIKSATNAGFAGGYKIAFEHANADYWFVVNQDTRVAPEAIKQLVQVLDRDPKAGAAEARQFPREHPKYYDPFTRETSWCSGACVMLRPRAVAESGGGFDTDFFMYAEDVDLSWRLWLNGWKCLYVPEAVVEHFTEDLDPDRKPMLQQFYSMRNGALMRVAYGTPGQVALHYLAMLRLVIYSYSPMWYRRGVFRALMASFKLLPAAYRKRGMVQKLPSNEWVKFNGWDYGRNLVDVALTPGEPIKASKASKTLVDAKFIRGLASERSSEVFVEPNVRLRNGASQAIRMKSCASLQFSVPSIGGTIVGKVALSKSSGCTWGRFLVERGYEILYRADIEGDPSGSHLWHEFSAIIPPGPSDNEVTLRFLAFTPSGESYWANVHVIETPNLERVKSYSDRPLISVVVPTHNRAGGISRVVHRLLNQENVPGEYEVILIDSNSSDDTPTVLQQLAKDSRIRTHRVTKKGASAARNAGLDRARGDLVVMMDDDILVRKDFLEQLWKNHIAHPDRILLTKIVAPWSGIVEPFQRYLLAAQEVNVYHFPDPDDVPPDYFFTGCVAVPRKIVGDTRFDENFTVYGVEDIEFGVRLLQNNVKMKYIDSLEVWHEYYPEFDYFAKKRMHSGYSLGYFLEQYPERSKHYVFQRWCQKHHRKLSLGIKLLRPLAYLGELFEKLKYSSGSVNRFTNLYYKVAIRVSMYHGLLHYKTTGGKPETLPTLKPSAAPLKRAG